MTQLQSDEYVQYVENSIVVSCILTMSFPVSHQWELRPPVVF